MNYNADVHIFPSAEELAEKFASYFEEEINKTGKNKITLALSGGSTPKLYYAALVNKQIDWRRIHFFWADERMVPPDSSESNYKLAKDNLFDTINLPEENIHRVLGELEPEAALAAYVKEIKDIAAYKDGLPCFDWVLLGVGNDGHTASLFPDKNYIKTEDDIALISVHPQSGQKRISLTFNCINNAERVSFIANGRDKAPVIKEIFNGGDYPAAHIKPLHGTLNWWLDKEAGKENQRTFLIGNK